LKKLRTSNCKSMKGPGPSGAQIRKALAKRGDKGFKLKERFARKS